MPTGAAESRWTRGRGRPWDLGSCSSPWFPTSERIGSVMCDRRPLDWLLLRTRQRRPSGLGRLVSRVAASDSARHAVRGPWTLTRAACKASEARHSLWLDEEGLRLLRRQYCPDVD